MIQTKPTQLRKVLGVPLGLIATLLLACQLPGRITLTPQATSIPTTAPVTPINLAQSNMVVETAGLTVTNAGQSAPMPAGAILLPTLTPEPTPDPRGMVTAARYVGRVELAALNGMISSIYPAEQVLPAQYSIDEYELRFTSFGLTNEPLTLLAQLFVPQVAEPQRFPLYVAGAGTTGIDDHCAPSLEDPAVRDMGNYRGHMLTYATQGYIVALPDYEGFNDPDRIHHYFVAELEGRALLDAARAVYSYFSFPPPPETQARPAGDIFFAGYSQGGHAAFAARDLAATYAPELRVAGAIGYGPTTDIAALLREGPRFAPYLIYAYADLYGAAAIDANAILLPPWSANLAADVLARCVDDIFDDYPNIAQEIYQPAFLDALYNNRLEETFPQVQARFAQNSSGLTPSPIAGLILQGLDDTIVTPATQQAFVDQLCRAGGNLTYLTYPGVVHFNTRQVSYVDTLAWMAQLGRGERPPLSCAG